MAQSVAQPTVAPAAVPAALPIRAILPWAAFFGILMLVLLYFVGAEQGATSLLSGSNVHEWVHDGRHLLGFPATDLSEGKQHMNSVTVRTLLVRGMLAGLAAGVLAFVVAYLLGEPRVDSAIAYEESHSHEHEMELVSRTLQSTAGLATGVLVFGIAMGGIAALAFCFALGRIGRFTPRATAALLAGAAFIAVYLVPFLKYPANPPSVGDPDTIGKRTTLYFLMMLLGVLLAVATVILGKRLAPRLGTWNATVTAGAFFVLAVGLSYAFLPAVNEVPAGFSATLLWQFRLAALAIQLTLWTSFGLLFGHLAQRVLEPRAAAAPALAPQAQSSV